MQGQEIEIRLNGETFQLPSGTTVAGLVRRLTLPEDRVAVELDGRIVPRQDWPRQQIESGAAVEIVQLVGGG